MLKVYGGPFVVRARLSRISSPRRASTRPDRVGVAGLRPRGRDFRVSVCVLAAVLAFPEALSAAGFDTGATGISGQSPPPLIVSFDVDTGAVEVCISGQSPPILMVEVGAILRADVGLIGLLDRSSGISPSGLSSARATRHHSIIRSHILGHQGLSSPPSLHITETKCAPRRPSPDAYLKAVDKKKKKCNKRKIIRV